MRFLQLVSYVNEIDLRALRAVSENECGELATLLYVVAIRLHRTPTVTLLILILNTGEGEGEGEGKGLSLLFFDTLYLHLVLTPVCSSHCPVILYELLEYYY